LPPEHQVEGLKIYREYWDRTMLDDVKLLPGALELLRGLHEESAAIAICTNKIGSSSRLICDKLGMTPFLKAVVGAGDTPWLKPDPEFTGHMVQLVGGTRDNCLLVGDSPYDIQAAHNGGLNAWCVTTGTHEAPQLRVAGADEVFDALPEIGRALGLESIRG
jgi:phosphoglycolate phosphatase